MFVFVELSGSTVSIEEVSVLHLELGIELMLVDRGEHLVRDLLLLIRRQGIGKLRMEALTRPPFWISGNVTIFLSVSMIPAFR